jgi:hypothetical protein
MDELNTFLKEQQNLYQQNNTYDINICSNISNNISNFNIEEQKFYSIIKKYRKYKLNYSQGKIYQDLNNICTTSCNRNNNIYNYILLDRKNIDYNQQSILVQNKKYENLDLFCNKKKYILEDNYEVLTVHINENLKIFFEIIGNSYQMKIQLSLENGIPNTYFEEYLKEIDNIIQSYSSYT